MRTHLTTVALVAAALAAPAAASEAAGQPRQLIGHAGRMPVYRVDHGTTKTRLYTTGELVESGTEQVWRPVCGSDPAVVTEATLRAIAGVHEAIFADADNEVVVVDRGLRGTGINIVYNLSGSVPAGAAVSFQLAEEFFEDLFGDPITVTINVSFANLGGGVLGSTSPFFQTATYASARSGLIADMDSDDTLQAFLPAGATVPVRYNASNATVTNENVVFFTRAGYRASIGEVGGTAANMSYNSAFNWDFDPRNGVGGSAQSLTDVVIHETGHAMGFISGVDFRTNDIDALDLLRFQRTDGSGDYNPDTTAEFGATPRTVDFNNPNDDANLDVISAEHRMSDGSPWQASHFREQSGNIGIMDPAQANGETYIGRGYFTQADLDAFDFIGYDYPPCAEPALSDQPDGQEVCEGGAIVLSVAAAEPATYQWYRDGVGLVNGGNVSGATSPTLTITDATLADAGSYSVDVTANDNGCTAESLPAQVVVNGAPIIFMQPPASQDKQEGETLALSISSIPPLYTFQWRHDGAPLSNGGRVSGATSTMLTITGLIPADAGEYDVLVTDPATGCQLASTATVVTVEPDASECLADCDGNSTLNLDDVECFTTAFLGADIHADCDGSGTLNIDDVDCFVSSFFSGCP